MIVFYLFLELQYEKPIQIQVELKYKPLDGQKIKTSVDIKWGPLLHLNRKKLYSNYDLLKVL